jgi:hypothetical protein
MAASVVTIQVVAVVPTTGTYSTSLVRVSTSGVASFKPAYAGFLPLLLWLSSCCRWSRPKGNEMSRRISFVWEKSISGKLGKHELYVRFGSIVEYWGD